MNTKIDPKEGQLRVFISYSHEDEGRVNKLVEALHENEIDPMWDKKFLSGQGFHEQIKSYISHSHVFMPFLTKSSSERGWVHQEIGYAMAMNIPILPVALEDLQSDPEQNLMSMKKDTKYLPAQMIQQLHALTLSSDALADKEFLKHKFSRQLFDTLVNEYRDASLCPMVCAELHEERTTMMIKYSDEILKFGHYSFIRQKGGLSSFHIPDKILSDPVWTERYVFPKIKFHCKLQRGERISFSRHALHAGCRLIITDGKFIEEEAIEQLKTGTLGSEELITIAKEKGIDLSQMVEKMEKPEDIARRIRKVRIETLLKFLEIIPHEKIGILIDRKLSKDISLTIIGDWFSAEAVAGSLKEGFKQTIFSTHAPSIKLKNELFDQEFSALLHDYGIKENESRDLTFELLKKEIKGIK